MIDNKKIKKPITAGVAKTPVVMQLEALECGAACLTMVLAYYGKWIPLEQVRSDCGVSRDGSNAKNVLLAARSYGLDANGYRFELDSIREDCTFPCIIHWEFNHFVVLNGFKGNKVYINDPARGSIVMTMEEFDKGFTGICLLFEPTDSFERSGKPKSMVDFALKRLKGAGVAVAFVLTTMVIADLLELINPAINRLYLDYLLTGTNPHVVMPFILCFSLFIAIQLVVAWINAIYSLKINGKMAVVGNTEYMWKVLSLPMNFFSQRMAGDIQQRKESNASIAATLVNTFAPILIDTAMMVFYLVVMIRYSAALTALGIFSVFLNLILSKIIAKKRVNITRVQMRDAGKLYGTTVSGIEMIETIKASGAENGFFRKWAGYQSSVNTQMMNYVKVDQIFGTLMTLINSLTSTSVLIGGVYLAMRGHFTVGMVMAFQGYLLSFTTPALSIVSAGQSLQEMRTEAERVEDVMAYPSDLDYKDKPDTGEGYTKLSGNIEMKNVTFGYSPLADPLIVDFNLKLTPGQRVAFVGASGCGKSTLSKLIAGLYKPWSGEILFDGKRIDEFDRSVFTGSVAVVDQDIVLFDDTIANNIKMWDSSIEDFEMIMAARDAQLHEDIVRRDGGYNYKLHEGGKDFSGGQRQRLEIARVLAQDPTVIIMDEATSALDAKTEYDVVRSIKDRGITCIVVAHRLSTIRDCDEIIVLDRGKVVERGRHEELYAKGGYYTQLVSSE